MARITKKGVRMMIFDSNAHLDPPPHKELIVATDGSGLRDGRAGWGATSRMREGDVVAGTYREDYGPVVTDPAHTEYIGAHKATNNTGELSAVYHMLTESAEELKEGEGLLIQADSLLAIHTTKGTWKARKNKRLVARNRAALDLLRRRGVHVRFEHVKAHAGHVMNERADALAKLGAQGARIRKGRPYDPPTPPPPSPPSPLPAPTGASENREWATVPD